MARLSTRQRKIRARRLKQLAEERDELLGELGEMALEMTRRGAIHRDYLAKGAAEVADIEREISELQNSLGLEDEESGEPGEPGAGPPAPEAGDEPAGLGERLKGLLGHLKGPGGAEEPSEESPSPPGKAPPPPPPEEPRSGDKSEARAQAEPTAPLWIISERSDEPPPEPQFEPERPLDGVRRVLAPPTLATAAVLAVGAVLILLAYSDLRSDAEQEARAGAISAQPVEQEPEAPPSEVASWPAGEEGWTVSLGSSVTEEGARSLARQAIDRGLEAGVLDTDDFASLESGMFVVFSGSYEIRAEAEEAAVAAQDVGYEDAFPLSVEP